MTEPAIHWGAEDLWQQLEPLLPGLSVEVVPRTLSTNTALLERARVAPHASSEADDALVRRSVESGAFGRRAVDLQPCLLVAEHQSGGRGRQGRVWQSAPGASLTFSLGLPLAVADWSGLSLAVGVALCEALDPAPVDSGHACIGLKWPNDLWLADAAERAAGTGRKLGGILIETVSAGVQRLVIVGVGLNVLPFDTPEASTGFASLHELDPHTSAPKALAQVAPALVSALKLFEREGFAAFAERFAPRDVLRGHAVRTTSADAPEGIARGVSAQGALRVQTASGMVDVASGEVSVRLAANAVAAAARGPVHEDAGVLRALVALLLLANLAFFAWTQGWLDSVVGMRSIGDREPERFARQVRPELVRVLAPGAASEPASSSALACLEAGPFTEAEFTDAQNTAQTALPAGSWADVKTEQPGTWIVYMGRYATREAFTKKADELKRRKLPFEEVTDTAALAPGLSLGRFDARAAADNALEKFAQQGIHTARVVELAPASARHLLRVDKADTALAAQLLALKGNGLGKGFAACAKPAGN